MGEGVEATALDKFERWLKDNQVPHRKVLSPGDQTWIYIASKRPWENCMRYMFNKAGRLIDWTAMDPAWMPE